MISQSAAPNALRGPPSPAGKALFSQPPANGKVQLYLIRHGATDLNEQGGAGKDRIRGWSNVPLNDHGRQEAQKLGQKLAGSGIRTLIHSDLDRARDTAQAISQTTGARLVPTPLLRPWNVGIYTGKDSNAAHPELQRLAMQSPDEPIPEGESFNQFKQRAAQGVHFTLLEGQGQPTGMVTHHRVERFLNAWLAAGQRPDLTIDPNVMFQKGEAPAQAKIISIDPRMFGQR